jgi:hypothetical protein
MAEIIKLHSQRDPDEVLRSAISIYDSVIVIGWTKEDNFNGLSTENLTAAEAILLVELFKAAVISEVF